MEKEPSSSNLSADIFSILKNRIVHWEYLPGHRITEVALSEEFGVSRSPIREALQALEDKGLIVKIPKLGYSVRQPDLQEVYELYEYRLALEQFLVERLAENGMDENSWQSLHEDWSNLLKNSKLIPPDISLQDERFHDTLSEVVGNSILSQKLKEVNERLHFVRMNDITSPERLELTCQQHLTILEMIKNKDVQGARKAVRNNIYEGRKNVDQAIKDALARAYFNKQG